MNLSQKATGKAIFPFIKQIRVGGRMTQHCSKISRTTTAKISVPLDRCGPQKQIKNSLDTYKTEYPTVA